MPKRTPYVITARCTLNGADITKLLYLPPSQHSPVYAALSTMKRYALPHERNSLRVIECRLANEDEIKAHKAAIAAL